jgi:hypothetical protein
MDGLIIESFCCRDTPVSPSLLRGFYFCVAGRSRFGEAMEGYNMCPQGLDYGSSTIWVCGIELADSRVRWEEVARPSCT